VEIAVLGPVEARLGGEPVDLGTPRQRAIVAALALSGGRTVPVDTVISRVWADRPPSGALATLHGYVAALRRALEPDRAPRAEPRVLVTDNDGYALRDCTVGSDVAQLEAAVADARSVLTLVPDHLRPRAEPADRPEVSAVLPVLDAALARWRGEPYADLGDDPSALAERVRLAGLRTSAQELRTVALLAVGRHAEALPELATLTAEHPLHERWWALYAVALARCGRQADALGALQSLRSLLADELGVDPSPPVRELQTALLRQESSVGWNERPAAPPTADLDHAPVARRTRFRESPPLARWPLAGRDDEVARLRDVLTAAASGRPTMVLVTGEAGVGKSRLVQELALDAFAEGFTVATGQCSAEGAPLLWPFRAVVYSLFRQRGMFGDRVGRRPTEPSDDVATIDALARHACDAANQGPLLGIFEDLQWADPATLRLLLRIQQLAQHEPLLVVATLRGDASSTELDEFTATFARQGGVRLDLRGLSPDASGDLVEIVTGSAASAADRNQWWELTAGNPFYLSELAQSGGELSSSLSGVVLHRVRSLPTPTVTALEAAAVVDVHFDLDLLAFALDRSPVETAELLQPAIDAGLVVDAAQETATYRFAHGVVREVVHDAQSQAERAAWHRVLAGVLEQRSRLVRPEQRAALMHHWGRAGRSARPDAWRAALRVAATARQQTAYDEEARHLRRAAVWQEDDLAAGDRERFELLMMLADACRWAGDWQGVSDAVDEAVLTAERLDDIALATRAAISTMEGALWQVRPFGYVHAPIVEALERALRRLPEDAKALRARAQLALAMELYYSDDVLRIDALVAEALAVAEASDDLRLRAVAHLGAFSARSRPDTMDDRVRYAREAVDAALRLDDTRTRLVAETLAVSVASEVGDAATVRRDLPRLVELTRAQGLGTAEALLRVVEVPWLAMSGRDDEADVPLERLGELARDLRMPNILDAVTATTVVRAMLTGQYAELAGFLGSFVEASDIPAGPVATVIALRAGDIELARRLHGQLGVDLAGHSFMALLYPCMALEIALGLDDPDLARAAYPLALPYAGRMCSAGTAAPVGPVDAFLARGAQAMGDDEAATAHAAAAVALARGWGLPRVVEDLAVVAQTYAR
jgi:DNA-binding SARP family transcriptional activator